MAGVVLAYHPEPDIVQNVNALLAQADEVFVVDNSPGETSRQILRPMASDARVTILEQPGNVGVAAGFNAGIRAALDNAADFVWIFDQDSTVTDGMLDKLLAAHAAAGKTAGIVAPALRSHATGVVYRRETGKGAGEVDVVISSGSLFSKQLLETIGLHDEPLFIDYVDHDISLRARAKGFRNYKVFDALLDHRFGDSDPVRLFGRRVYLANYSPMRQFHMARNRLIVLRRYGLGRWFWEDFWFTSKAWVKVLLLETDRPAKIRAAARGLWAGVRFDVRS
ncbi:glycosyltransferase family 2 protein [Microbacterium sp. LWH7-1.2]|uniref:glycosyltransferase family 2 protein n=1 Tax=Microbacterium sp. LWH7-1.2 TaxID=3135257 RepID=UPI003138A215